MLVITPSIFIDQAELEFTFVRSPGPGGQNVNKVNSKAVLKWSLEDSPSIPEAVKLRFKQRYANRVGKDGKVTITSHRYRDQRRNTADCLNKLRDLVLTVVSEPTRRKSKPISKKAKQKRLDAKKLNSQKKQQRKFFRRDD